MLPDHHDLYTFNTFLINYLYRYPLIDSRLGCTCDHVHFSMTVSYDHSGPSERLQRQHISGQKPKNAFVGLLLNLQKRLLPGSPLDDPYVIDKEIFLIPFFTGDFFENF
jgi:hypothetical protein